MLSLFFVFFFKQKTAYEMRISDWSSDVCSFDLWYDLLSFTTGISRRIILLQGHFPLSPTEVLRSAIKYQGDALRDSLQVVDTKLAMRKLQKIGRASCRERVCQYV